MSPICLPLPLVLLARRLVAALSITRSFLMPHLELEPSINGPLARTTWSIMSIVKVISLPAWWSFLPGNLRTASRVEKKADEDGSSEKESEVSPAPGPPHMSSPRHKPDLDAPIYRLMNSPTLFNPIRTPRNPIVLCHGLYGFDVRGLSAFPKLQLHYWSDVLEILRKKIGAEVIVSGVPGTGSISERAVKMDQFLEDNARGRELNFVAHSMGGLDCRQLITHIQPQEYRPLSLTTISTPHRGSPFMDWCQAKIGIGHRKGLPLPSPLVPLPTLLLSLLDSPAYSNLTTHFLQNYFNPNTPDSPHVKYYSVAARTSKMSFFHPLWLPKLVLDEAEEKAGKAAGTGGPKNLEGLEQGNDGLVTVESAKWGQFLGTVEECDHWDIRGAGGFSGYSPEVDLSKGSGNQDGWAAKEWNDFFGLWREKSGAQDPIQLPAPPTVAGQQPHTPSESTLSSVLDWVAEHIPGTSPTSISPDPPVSPAPRKEEQPVPRFDLERFYTALSRKLYDDGL